MARQTTDQIKMIRDRLVERAAAGAPAWLVPVTPSARHCANALMIGGLLRRLPDEDASALCQSILHEQNDDGSWSGEFAETGDLSATLEVVESLSLSSRPEVRLALQKAVGWLERNQRFRDIEWDSLVLLSAVTGVDRGKWFPWYRFQLSRKFRSPRSRAFPLAPSLNVSRKLLARDAGRAALQSGKLLRLQRADGSWDGLARSTVFALTALRHAGLDLADSAFERGWRFLRSHQHWGTIGLVQNPADLSMILHASAVRSLLMSGSSPNAVAGSLLSLLHHGTNEGGWGAGTQSPTDLFSTSLVLDALTLAGDIPVETAWARRRATMLLCRTQKLSGGWPLYIPAALQSLRARDSVDATAMAVSALNDNLEFGDAPYSSVKRGVRFLIRAQKSDGWWQSDLVGDPLFTTCRVVEALTDAAPEQSRGAVLNALRAVRDQQNPDGGWGPDQSSSPAQTAWAVRAMQQVPGLYKQAISRARGFLMDSLDESGLVWCSDRPTARLPIDPHPIELWDLTTIWVLEAFLSAPHRKSRRPRRTARSIFDRRT